MCCRSSGRLARELSSYTFLTLSQLDLMCGRRRNPSLEQDPVQTEWAMAIRRRDAECTSYSHQPTPFSLFERPCTTVFTAVQTFLFKLASPGQEKSMLLLESGVRFHTTK